VRVRYSIPSAGLARLLTACRSTRVTVRAGIGGHPTPGEHEARDVIRYSARVIGTAFAETKYRASQQSRKPVRSAFQARLWLALGRAAASARRVDRHKPAPRPITAAAFPSAGQLEADDLSPMLGTACRYWLAMVAMIVFRRACGFCRLARRPFRRRRPLFEMGGRMSKKSLLVRIGVIAHRIRNAVRPPRSGGSSTSRRSLIPRTADRTWR